MSSRVRLRRSLCAEMLAHAAAAGRRESCGLVAFDSDGKPRRVYALQNVAPGADEFEIDPVGHHDSIVDAEHQGWSIAGVFHSHPRGPRGPSERDLAAELDSTWVSFIVSPWDGEWRVSAFSIRNGEATELEVILEDAPPSLR